MVTNPRNVIVAENVFSQGYVRGNGVKFFTADLTCPLTAPPAGYSPDDGEHTADLIAVLVEPGSAQRLPNPLDIEGHTRYDPALVSTKVQTTSPGDAKVSAYCDANYVTEMFSLHEFSRDRSDPASEPFIDHERTQNTICFRGHQFSYDPTTKQHTAVSINTGHWGKNVYPGCGRVRNGDIKYLEVQNFKPTVSIA